ncbi:MAG: AAA family ATPase [Bacteroidales bacterium]|nr:AAA family ATPase [Bacteroidales bacterium]MCF8344363.1 AAA family ATPase [Bacteroidales bacterium]MCF8351682.1 AAA family ATPase [Bacteroidales bacterium]MCF8376239.1 AAA family ATPase [Bacteroidales bacterium]MCF8401204.1 AAA family ATPase [Bacteroidales bacterium]
MITIGITGTLGAGKGTIVEYLVGKKRFRHYSVRGFLTEEIRKRGMPLNRDSMTHLANELRALHGPSFIADELYREASEADVNSVIESIRTPGEVELLRSKKNFYLFAVDADPEKRYKRITLRNSETDSISYETFLANEKREMQSEDPNKQNLKKCIYMADFVFTNNGTKEELFDQVEKALIKIMTDNISG